MAEDNNILDFYPEGEDEACAEDSYVTLVDEDGNEVTFEVSISLSTRARTMLFSCPSKISNRAICSSP